MNKFAIAGIAGLTFVVGAAAGASSKDEAKTVETASTVSTAPPVPKTVTSIVTKTVTKTVKETPDSCREALGLADTGFSIAGDAFGLAGEGFAAAAAGIQGVIDTDVAAVKDATATMSGIRDQITEKTGELTTVADDYRAAKTECLGS